MMPNWAVVLWIIAIGLMPLAVTAFVALLRAAS